MMLPPLHAPTGTKILHCTRTDMEKVLHQHIGARQIDWPLGIGQAEGLLLIEEIGVGLGVIIDVTTRGLVAEPLADITFVRARSLRQFGGSQLTFRKFAIKPEFVPDQHQYRANRSTEIADSFAEECLKLFWGRCHFRLLPSLTFRNQSRLMKLQ